MHSPEVALVQIPHPSITIENSAYSPIYNPNSWTSLESQREKAIIALMRLKDSSMSQEQKDHLSFILRSKLSHLESLSFRFLGLCYPDTNFLVY